MYTRRRRSAIPRTTAPRKQPEGMIVYECIKYLLDRGHYVWRNSVGCCKAGGRWLQFGKKGSSDILGITGEGKFLAVECKTATGRLRPEQKEFLDHIRVNGGSAIVARSVDDLVKEGL